MSSRKAFRAARSLVALGLLSLVGSLGCWEQWSNAWFPQMKWQPAVQAFERVNFEGQLQGFSPPEGTIPIGGGEPDNSQMTDEETVSMVNPQPMTMRSLEHGREVFLVYCRTCHGDGGLGDGPVSMVGSIMGPFAGVLPIAGPASVARVRPDGHIYNTIRYGRRRMPSYRRIPPETRWDIVNYIRYINQPGAELW